MTNLVVILWNITLSTDDTTGKNFTGHDVISLVIISLGQYFVTFFVSDNSNNPSY